MENVAARLQQTHEAHVCPRLCCISDCFHAPRTNFLSYLLSHATVNHPNKHNIFTEHDGLLYASVVVVVVVVVVILVVVAASLW